VAYYDVAIVKVAHVTFSNSIAPICLSVRPDPDGDNFVQRSATVAGWGSYNLSNVASDSLKTAALTILSSK